MNPAERLRFVRTRSRGGARNEVFQRDAVECFSKLSETSIVKFNDCSSDAFVLHLKDREWRYDHRHEDLFPLVKKLYRKIYLD